MKLELLFAALLPSPTSLPSPKLLRMGELPTDATSLAVGNPLLGLLLALEEAEGTVMVSERQAANNSRTSAIQRG